MIYGLLFIIKMIFDDKCIFTNNGGVDMQNNDQYNIKDELSSSKKVFLSDELIKMYLAKLQGYCVYCKDEKMADWLMVTCGLVNSIGSIQKSDWLYEASLFETTCLMLEKIHENVDWQEVSSECDLLTHGEVEAVGELLLEFSPNGISFVENLSKNSNFNYNDMDRLKDVYAVAKRKVYHERNARKK